MGNGDETQAAVSYQRSVDVAREYGELKKRLATRYADDIDGYTDGKTDAILRMLRMAGLRADAPSRRPLTAPRHAVITRWVAGRTGVRGPGRIPAGRPRGGVRS